MSLLIGYEILESYKRLSYKEWYALAEFVDNSTQSFRNNKNTLQELFKERGEQLCVTISYNNIAPNDYIKIQDNAMGMNLLELRNALILGKRPINDKERSKYGLGLKTSSFWFGDSWTITTKKLGESKEYSIIVDLENILNEEKSHNEKQSKLPPEQRSPFTPHLNFTETDADLEKHGTTIVIRKLNRKLTAARAKKSKKYLRSIYRMDLQKGDLKLIFQDEELTWTKDEILNRLYVDNDGNKFYREINLIVNDHHVRGWAGILKHGSREDAGFSLLQADRVIQGWPDSYKPSLLYGDQEGGINNLVNQRLTGELFLDGFEVSHTKDEILFKDDEEEILDRELMRQLADYKKFAEGLRIKVRDAEEVDYSTITQLIIDKLISPELKASVSHQEILPEEIIEKTNEEAFNRLLETSNLKFEATIDNLLITVIISENGSPYDPYVLSKARAEINHLTVIVNKSHIYWRGLKKPDLVYEFLKHCIYDGISEWKANFRQNSLNPDTIKTIKDYLLRVDLDVPF